MEHSRGAVGAICDESDYSEEFGGRNQSRYGSGEVLSEIDEDGVEVCVWK